MTARAQPVKAMAEPALDLFGDESARTGVVTYGLVVVPIAKRPAVETMLSEVKRFYRAAAITRIHCRTLFPGDARRKTPWAHLSSPFAFSLCLDIAQELVKAGATFRLAYIRTDQLPKTLVIAGKWPETPAGDKQLISFAYTAVFAGFEKDPGFDRLRLWADPDRTRISWGAATRQAGRHPMTYEGGISIEPQSYGEVKPMLLDVADILAYSGAQSHATEGRADQKKFREIYSAFRPQEIVFEFHPQAFEVSLPRDSADTH